MMRWTLVLLVLCLTGLALVGIRHYRPDASSIDEILAYEITPERGVTALIPGGTRKLFLTSWTVVAPQSEFQRTRAYPYSVQVEVNNEAGQQLLRQRLQSVSRISGDPREPLEKAAFAARMVDVPDWVTDPRTTTLDVSRLEGRPGRIRLRAVAGPHSTVLVRLGFAQPRGALEREIAERTLRHDQRQRLVANRSALGFADLPASARELALTAWGRRITALGRSGIDYVSRRLLLSDYRSAPNDALPQARGLEVGPDQLAALNLRGPVTLRVQAPPGTTLSVQEDVQQPYSAVVGESGQVDLEPQQAGLRSVSIGATARTRVAFSLAGKQASAQAGEVQPIVRGDRVEVVPDTRVQHTLRLDPHDPVVASLQPGQDLIGVTVRSVQTRAGPGRFGELQVRWRGQGVDSAPATLRPTLATSQYDSAEGRPVTNRAVALLRPPPGAAQATPYRPQEAIDAGAQIVRKGRRRRAFQAYT